MHEIPPRVSIIMPTLNAERILRDCLSSLAQQRQPPGGSELLVVDAGSTDHTREIALQYGANILDNPRLTTEAGAAIGLKAARGDIVAFIDSDNILVGQNWLERMLAPFEDPDIVGAEPMYFVSREHDGYLTRYFAHLGMGDPLCLFLGSYDHHCALTGRWTGLPVTITKCPDYDKAWFLPGQVPTIGANGFLVRRAVLDDLGIGEYWFDVDVMRQIAEQPGRAFALVHCGITHVYVREVRAFQRKQRRRVLDFLHFRKQNLRAPSPAQVDWRGIARFAIATATGWPLIWQAILGYARTGDPAWFFHPAACALTLFEYARAVLLSKWQSGPMSRQGWTQ